MNMYIVQNFVFVRLVLFKYYINLIEFNNHSYKLLFI